MLFTLSPQELLFLVPILLMSLSVHEFFHGWVSSLQGDPLPRREGRLTLNPFRHLDLWGTLMLLTAGFGWAKPVPVDINSYKRKYTGLILTSLAGPFSNLLIAVMFTLLLRFIYLGEALAFMRREGVVTVIQYVLIINTLLFLFNLIPIPPLDGSRVVSALFNRHSAFIRTYNRWGVYVLLAILLSNRVLDIEIIPLSAMMGGVLRFMFALIIPEMGT